MPQLDIYIFFNLSLSVFIFFFFFFFIFKFFFFSMMFRFIILSKWLKMDLNRNYKIIKINENNYFYTLNMVLFILSNKLKNA